VRRSASLVGVLIGLAAAIAPALAIAQERPWSVYVAGAACGPRESGPNGEISTTYLTAPGGFTAGWAVTAGLFVSPRVSVEAEWSATGIMRATEHSRYDQTYHERRRDNLLSVNLRLHFRPRRLDIEPVVGFDMVDAERWSTVEYVPSWDPVPRSWSSHEHLTTVAGFSFGLDWRIGGRHFAVVPSIRAHVTFRGDGGFDTYPGAGLPVWTVSPSIGIRYGF